MFAPNFDVFVPRACHENNVGFDKHYKTLRLLPEFVYFKLHQRKNGDT